MKGYLGLENAPQDSSPLAVNATNITGDGTVGSPINTVQNIDPTASPTFAGMTLSGNTWKIFYSNGSSVLIPLALGASGTVLQSNGASSAPSFATPTAGGGVGLETVLMLGGM